MTKKDMVCISSHVIAPPLRTKRRITVALEWLGWPRNAYLWVFHRLLKYPHSGATRGAPNANTASIYVKLGNINGVVDDWKGLVINRMELRV